MDDPMIHDQQHPEADLARLADGSLPDQRRGELRAEVESSGALAQALAQQERALVMLRSVDVVAPDSLRAAVQDQIRAARTVRPWRLRRRLSVGVRAAAAVAAVAAVVIVLLAPGGATGPTLPQTVALTLASATYPAPPEAPGTSGTLADTAAGIAFPYWQRSVGWRALGARADRFAGRRVVTVYYGGRSGGRVGYAIVGGAPLAVRGGLSQTRHGIAFRLLHEGSVRLVTWLRSGHTCVIAGRAVSDQTLLTLATADLTKG